MIYASFFSEYVLPILIFVPMAGALAFVLAYFGQKFNVVEDDRHAEIRDLLAGINCGACGYASCDAFTAGILKGEAHINQCNPTSSEKKAKIAELLGVKIEKSERLRAVVNCGGGKNCKDKGEYLGYADCKSENMLSGGVKACGDGCMGHGDCKNVCDFDAIYVDSGCATVIAHKCETCGACVKECPKNIIGYIPARAKVYINCSSHKKGKQVSSVCSVGCIGCAICEKACKFDAIKMDDNLPIIDYKKCTGCGECADKCPMKTIVKI